jgi:pimeloyl-ACP methyl ester carboxylesterase
LSLPMLRPTANGWRLHYDPAIAQPFVGMPQTMDQAAHEAQQALWALYDAIACPSLLLRGAQSDLLSPATAQAMTQRGPRATLHTVADVGHAPTLVQPAQINVVRDFLLSPVAP